MDVTVSEQESVIQVGRNGLVVPDKPIIPYIEGDGIGPDLWHASQPVWDAAVANAYGGKRKIEWREVLAGEKAMAEAGTPLPSATLQALRRYRVGIKGPLTTPIGAGMRSLNVALRVELDLYACVRPVRYFQGTPSPVRHPENVDMVIFRENTEDVYVGIEWAAGTSEAEEVRRFLVERMAAHLPAGPLGIGIKPMSREGTRRLVRKAIEYALSHSRPSVTLVHKGNIMKYTEGAFRDWGYELAAEEFGDRTVREGEPGAGSDGRIVIKDRIADSMFQQVLLRPAEYDVVCCPNLNGDYLSDALAAQVGGLGMAPGGNLSDDVAVFEATHGTAPKYAGLDKANPGSLLLSGALLLDHLGWTEAAELIRTGMERAIADKVVTYDLARQMSGATEVSSSAFGQAIVKRMERRAA